uniref:Uncharacterized protein n=1 Tax=Nelumbo nucifera TaxID=4432 RepID=A0A822Z9T7_NELNU|nr:TPA_asm: hypothetical protein HUJ06_016155 [Nelumbo nucifera]
MATPGKCFLVTGPPVSENEIPTNENTGTRFQCLVNLNRQAVFSYCCCLLPSCSFFQGVGKTTLVMRVLERIRTTNPNLKVQGFYTRMFLICLSYYLYMYDVLFFFFFGGSS